MPTSSQTLAPQTLLHQTYRIITVLGRGGFGITYLAKEKSLDKKVAIKEFFPKELCNRDETTSRVSVATSESTDTVNRLKSKFLKEAKIIAKFNHPNIVRVHTYFEENGTAYYVMEYVEGESLAARIDRLGEMSEAEARSCIGEICDALSYIHKHHINHLDVKPSNVMIDHDGHLIVIDFGLSKQYDREGEQTSTTPVGISHGYAPIEQYTPGGVSSFSPESDIYSLGATLYKMLTGMTPPDAIHVAQNGLPALPDSISGPMREAIRRAMSLNKADRPHSIAEFREILEAAPDEDGETVIKTDKHKKPLKPDKPDKPLKPEKPEKPEKPVKPKPKPDVVGNVIKAIVGIATVVGLIALGISKYNKLRLASQRSNIDSIVEVIADDYVYPDTSVVRPSPAPPAESTPAPQTTSSSSNVTPVIANGKVIKPSGPSPIGRRERTLGDLLFFPLATLPDKSMPSNDDVRAAVREAFGSCETINALQVGLHRGDNFDYTYRGARIAVATTQHFTGDPDQSWFYFVFDSHSKADAFSKTLREDLIAAGLPMTKDKIYGGWSTRTKKTPYFKWVYVDDPKHCTKADNSNLLTSDMVGKYYVEMGVYLK